jgi:hypothetical protein
LNVVAARAGDKPAVLPIIGASPIDRRISDPVSAIARRRLVAYVPAQILGFPKR